jgi:hypothetical protein
MRQRADLTADSFAAIQVWISLRMFRGERSCRHEVIFESRMQSDR